jgi:hypothetical protein
MDSLERPKQRKLYVRFGTWKVRILCRARSLRTVTRQYRSIRFSGSTGCQMGQGHTERAGDCILIYGNGNESHELGTEFCT